MVSNLTGYVVQPNKAIVGRNAFATNRASTRRLAAESSTFEIMKPADVGFTTATWCWASTRAGTPCGPGSRSSATGSPTSS